MTAHSPLQRQGRSGFTLIELVLDIVILGVLAGIALPAYVSMSKNAEQSGTEYMIGSLSSALNIYSTKQLTIGQPPVSHNPFDNLAIQPNNYAGAFGDVDLSNCAPGQWAWQIGNGSNGNWPIIVYRTKASMTSAFGWGGAQWIIYEVKPVIDSRGNTVGMTIIEYPPAHVW